MEEAIVCEYMTEGKEPDPELAGVLTWHLEGFGAVSVCRLINATNGKPLTTANPAVFGLLALLALRAEPRLQKAARQLGLQIQFPAPPAPVKAPHPRPIPSCGLGEWAALQRILETVEEGWGELADETKKWLTEWAEGLPR